MPMGRPRAVIFVTPDRWRVLLAPVRADLVENLRALGPCPIARVAEAIGRRPDTLYRHVDQLERAGFIVTTGHRKNGRHVERLIDTTADDFQLDTGPSTDPAAMNRGFAELTRGFLRTAAGVVSASARAQGLKLDPVRRNVALSYEQSRLTPADVAKVRSLIARIKAIMDRRKRHRHGELFLTLSLLAPVTLARPLPRGRVRRSARSPKSSLVVRASVPRSAP